MTYFKDDPCRFSEWQPSKFRSILVKFDKIHFQNEKKMKRSTDNFLNSTRILNTILLNFFFFLQHVQNWQNRIKYCLEVIFLTSGPTFWVSEDAGSLSTENQCYNLKLTSITDFANVTNFTLLANRNRNWLRRL